MREKVKTSGRKTLKQEIDEPREARVFFLSFFGCQMATLAKK
jgi:hypothetical protein